MGYGGFFMLEYQKSSDATPHARNALGVRCGCNISPSGPRLNFESRDLINSKNACAKVDEQSNV
jgi:hypothetical protein